MAYLDAPLTSPRSVFFFRNRRSKRYINPDGPVNALKQLVKWLPSQPLHNAALDTINLAGDLVAGNTKYRDAQRLERWRLKRIEKLIKAMNEARSLEEYEVCTTELDRLQGHEEWKTTFESIEADYNPHVIQANMRALKNAADSGDPSTMLPLIRTALTRDLGGMGLLRLYKHSWIGTKRLIEDYIETAVGTIEKFEESTKLQCPSTDQLRHYQTSLEEALKYFGRSALTLSGGAILGMKHVGVVKALWREDLLPDIISGASAGSIVAAIVCASTDDEMVHVLKYFPMSDLAVFDAPGVQNIQWLTERGRLLLSTGAFFAINNLERVMKIWLKDLTFREAHNKTGRILNVCISRADNSEARLLNYVTAPDVYLWSAVCASCSVPFVFQPATIYEKDQTTGESKIWMLHSQQWVDGSLDHDIPMRKLSEMFNVNFFIVSQVNPHVRVFLEKEEEFTGIQPTQTNIGPTVGRQIMSLVKDETIYRAQLASDIGLPRLLTRGASLFSQQYIGDINILPDIEKGEYATMMANPTPDFMVRAMLAGEKATWPRMCRIKNSVAIEKALITAIADFRDRVNFGPEAARERQNLRNSSRGRHSRRGHQQRPSFLRRRSLSTEVADHTVAGLGRPTTTNGPPSVSPHRVMKRNRSAGSVMERLWLGFTPNMTTTAAMAGAEPSAPGPGVLLGSSILSPQAGVGDEFTTPTPARSEPGTPSARQYDARFVFTLGGDESEVEADGDGDIDWFTDAEAREDGALRQPGGGPDASALAESMAQTEPTSPIADFRTYMEGLGAGAGAARSRRGSGGGNGDGPPDHICHVWTTGSTAVP